MVKVLVIHGSGMNMWGKIQVDIVGPKSLEQLNSEICSWANTLGMEVDIFQSNIEGEVVNRLYDAHDQGVAAAILNPAGWTTSTGALVTAISQVRYPVIEIHASNPAVRGTTSQIQRVCKGLIFGFGYFGYYIALQGAKDLGTAQSDKVQPWFQCDEASMTEISLAESERIIQAGIAKAGQMGLTISIAVVDANGHLKGMMRMDGDRFYSAEVCQGKARAAA